MDEEYYDWGLGSGADDPYWSNLGDPTKTAQYNAIVNAKNTAISSGASPWYIKALDVFLKYGDPVLTILVKTGTIPNKSNSTIGDASKWDIDKIKQLFGETGTPSLSDIETNAEKVTNGTSDRNSTNEIFGIPTSYLLVGLALFIGYMIYKDKDEPKKNKS